MRCIKWFTSLVIHQPYVLFPLKEETTKPYLSSLQQHLLTQGALPAKTPIWFRQNLSGNVLKCLPHSTLLLKTVTVSEVSLNASPVRGSWDRHCRQERAVELNSKLFENLLVPWFWSVLGERENPTTWLWNKQYLLQPQAGSCKRWKFRMPCLTTNLGHF